MLCPRLRLSQFLLSVAVIQASRLFRWLRHPQTTLACLLGVSKSPRTFSSIDTFNQQQTRQPESLGVVCDSTQCMPVVVRLSFRRTPHTENNSERLERLDSQKRVGKLWTMKNTGAEGRFQMFLNFVEILSSNAERMRNMPAGSSPCSAVTFIWMLNSRWSFEFPFVCCCVLTIAVIDVACMYLDAAPRPPVDDSAVLNSAFNWPE